MHWLRQGLTLLLAVLAIAAGGLFALTEHAGRPSGSRAFSTAVATLRNLDSARARSGCCHRVWQRELCWLSGVPPLSVGFASNEIACWRLLRRAPERDTE
jgi:hypothetical protein